MRVKTINSFQVQLKFGENRISCEKGVAKTQADTDTSATKSGHISRSCENGLNLLKLGTADFGCLDQENLESRTGKVTW